ncbi:hypothetical protein [Streptomyces sp. col6]|uniref:hypothetical protein n=1 Tax=Streptomyces sp. col6 TaxID=2478958 RepID=UPI001CD0B498|nr:hypothetical protein [Streptomyces sp. col6]
MVAPRSGACGPDCASAPCTLRQLRTAQRLSEQDELRIALWAEMTVASHLLGWITPLPGEAMRHGLASDRAADRRLVDCAIGQAVDRAVHSRAGAVGAPHALAEHVAGLMRAQLDGDDPCPVGEPRWKAAKGVRTRQYYHGRHTPSVLEKAVGCADPSEEWAGRFARAVACFERKPRRPVAVPPATKEKP